MADEDAFDSAWSDEQVETSNAAEATVETEQHQEAETEAQAEAGDQIAAEASETEAEAGDEAGADEGDEGDEGQGQQQRRREPRIPLKEHLQERDKRQQAEARLDMLQRELEALKQPKRPEQAETEEKTFWDDPEGVINGLKQSFEAELTRRDVVSSMRFAERQYGDEFKEAFTFVNERLDHDPALKVRLMQAPDHGEAIMREYRRERTLTEVGDDPAQYREKLQSELLADPEFLQKAIEAAQAQARGQATPNGGRPRNQVQLPPSLSRATSAAPNGDPDEHATDGAGLFDDAFSGR